MLVGDTDNWGGCACVGPVGLWQISVPPFQFCCEPKTALKNEVYLKKNTLFICRNLQLILKFIWKLKGPTVAKAILKKDQSWRIHFPISKLKQSV